MAGVHLHKGWIAIALLSLLTAGCDDQSKGERVPQPPKHAAYDLVTRCGGRLSDWGSALNLSTSLIQISLLTNGQIAWDGTTTPAATFSTYVGQAQALPGPMDIMLKIEKGADCNQVRAIRWEIEQAGLCTQYGKCNELMVGEKPSFVSQE